MLLALKEIVTIRTGVFAKASTHPVLYYMQGNDVESIGKIKDNLKPVLDITPNLNKHVLRYGEILFVAKGREFVAALYDGSHSPAVASGAFLVITSDTCKVLPEFLVWYLNHPKTNNLLNQLARGSALPMITKSSLEKIEIFLPSIALQQKIVTINKLQFQEQQLLHKIYLLKENHLNELTYTLIQK